MDRKLTGELETVRMRRSPEPHIPGALAPSLLVVQMVASKKDQKHMVSFVNLWKTEEMLQV